MKLKLTLLLSVALFPLFAFAQGGSLTIFSEDGDKFYLLLNGQKQNNTPQANVRIDALTQPYYKAKIVFEDKAKGDIDKNITVTDAATNAPADVVYKIKNKDGEMKLRFFSTQPIQPNYTPPADVYSMHYGQDAPAAPANTVTQTTVTTTQVNPNSSMSVSAPGVNISVNMPDGSMGTTTTETTVTRSTTTTTSDNSYNQAQPAAQPAGCQYPMDFGSFKSAKETVQKASFEDTKLSTAKSILAGNCVSTDQVMAICKLFSFEASKLDFAKFAYGKTTDKGNYFKVGSIFDFDASKTDLNNFISNGGR